MARASRGGQVGMNGEQYQGGQFLPNTTLPKMTPAQRKDATRKQEIAPYTWEVAPNGERSIYRMVAGVFGKVVNDTMIFVASDVTLDYYKMSRDEVQRLIDRWNNGERWTV